MRYSSVLSLISSLLLLASVAWSWPDIFDDILKRDDTTSLVSTASPTNTASDTSATSVTATGTDTTDSTASATDSTTTTTNSNTGTNTNTITGTNTNTTTSHASKTTSSTKTTSISVDPEWPAGGASMTNPASTSTTYYKIGQNVTFGWNFTSVEITPTAVNVIASCSLNSATYTLANNVSYANATSVVWDTDNYGSQAQSPLLTAHYTLIIYEAGTSPTAVGSAGQLGPASYTFGMYTPEAYTPLASYVCVTCSAGVPSMDRQTVGLVLTVAAITVFSFTSFVGGFALF